VQTAENLAAHGLVDDVVSLAELRDRLARLLAVVHPDARPQPRPPLVRPPTATRRVDPWEAVTRTRQANRPGARELLAGARDLTQLRGDGQGGLDDPAVLLCLCRLGGEPVVVVAEDRTAGPPGPDGLRKARRGIALAAALRLALVTVVDTPGVRSGGSAGRLPVRVARHSGGDRGRAARPGRRRGRARAAGGRPGDRR
jgi:acetyl-CoA carboxylase carboxyl transferase subunit beta